MSYEVILKVRLKDYCLSRICVECLFYYDGYCLVQELSKDHKPPFKFEVVS